MVHGSPARLVGAAVNQPCEEGKALLLEFVDSWPPTLTRKIFYRSDDEQQFFHGPPSGEQSKPLSLNVVHQMN